MQQHGWKKCVIDDLSPFITSGSRGWAGYYSSTGALFLRITNLTREHPFLDLRDKKYVALPTSNTEGARTKVQHEDVLVSITADLGIIGYVTSEVAETGAYINQHIALVRIRSPKVVNQFLAYYLSGPRAQKRFRQIADRGAKTGLNLDAIRHFSVEYPSLEEQSRTVELLSTWDRAIEQTERLIAAKRRRKQALMQQLLTGRRRFKEFVRSRSVQDTKFGPVPKDWQYLKVGDFASEVTERNVTGEDLPVLSCTKYGGLVESLKYFGKRVFSEDTTNYKVVRRNQFAYPCNHVEEGSIGVLDFMDVGIVSPIYAVFQADTRAHVPFLYALFKTELYRHIFEVSTSASVDRRGSLRWSQFAQIKVALPRLEEQTKIADCLACSDRETDGLRHRLDAMKHQKRGLMQQLLTGKVRVASL